MQSVLDHPPVDRSLALEDDARRIAARMEKGKYLVVAFLTVFYAIGAILHARAKPLWFDEIITVIAASQPGAAATWNAARAIDANPPLPHLLTHYSLQWFGWSEAAIRLPAIAGFWVFCLCLFLFTRRLGIFFALSAMLLPIATEGYNYAYEARAYGLELGFCGLALVAWQEASSGRRRVPACAGLAIALAGAIFCHYYALLLYIPFAGAEAYRTVRARRIDWPVWLALAAGALPVVWRLASILGTVQSFSHGTWSPAYPEQVLEFWENALQHSLSFVVLGLVFGAVWMMRRKTTSTGVSSPTLAPHELVAAIGFIAIPLAAVGGGLFVTHMFTERYTLIAIAGAVILAIALAARLSGGAALPGFVLFCLSMLPLAFVTLEVPPRTDVFADEKILAEALQKGPVVVPDGQLFLQMWHYAPAALKPNIIYLADAASAATYMGFDKIDTGLMVLRPWSSVRVIPYQDFAAPGKEFTVYQNSLKPGWVMDRAAANGAHAEVLAFTNFRQLYLVHLP